MQVPHKIATMFSPPVSSLQQITPELPAMFCKKKYFYQIWARPNN